MSSTPEPQVGYLAQAYGTAGIKLGRLVEADAITSRAGPSTRTASIASSRARRSQTSRSSTPRSKPSQSRAHLLDPELGYLTGSGFASQVTALGGIVDSGRTSMAGLPCLGGGSNNSIASTDLQGLGNGGAAQTQADGEVTDDGVNGTVTNEIADVELLDGLIEVDAIRSVANVDMTEDGEIELDAHVGGHDAGTKIQVGHAEAGITPLTLGEPASQ